MKDTPRQALKHPSPNRDGRSGHLAFFSFRIRRSETSMDVKPFPRLLTGRLVLREIVPEDASAIFHFRSDPEVQRYNGGPIAELRQALELIEELAEGYRAGTTLEWGVTLKGGEERVIGIIGYANWDARTRQAEIGYCLAKEYWRRGIATETMNAIIAYGFDAMKLNKIHACPWAENAASVGLLEKLGFFREGVRRDEYWADGAFHDEALYSMLRREYPPNGKTANDRGAESGIVQAITAQAE
jgi:ribosomal-protein-alanine N-acetyltransferase